MAGKTPDLVDVLQEEDLEEKFWLPQLAKLNVESVKDLSRIEGDTTSLSTLQKVIRHPREKEALQKLLKINENTTNKCEVGTKEIKKQHEKAEQEAEVMEIEKAREDAEKKFNEVEHELVEARLGLEKCACKQLHVTDKPLEKFISIKDNEALQSKKELNDATLLQKVSDGRALQGVLLTKNIQDQQEKRECLLKVPENVSIAGNSCLKVDIASFSSKHQEDSYKATGDVLGHSIAVSAQAPVYGNIAIGAGVSESGRNEEESTTNTINYTSEIKFCSMHVASYTIGNSDLILSDDAKEKLEGIKTASESDVQRECERFFHTYGSHVNQGPLQFGGSFGWTCSSCGVDTEEMETVKKMQREAVTAGGGVPLDEFGVSSGPEVSFESIKSKYAGKCSESTLASTHLVFNVNGGQTEFSDLSVWKAGLVANNSTWILADRGSKLVAVWDVIGMNHQKELGEVREVLRKAWEEMTGLQSKLDFVKYDPEEVLREVSKWNGKELTPRELEDNLHYLLKVKEDLRQPQDWVHEYLSQNAVQEFLSLVVKYEADYSTTGNIKFLVQKIAEEKELEKLSTFPDIDRISKWLYKKFEQPSSLEINCINFEIFFSYLRTAHVTPDTNGTFLNSKGSIISHSEIVATNLSRAICSLRSNYQDTYDDILIKILAFPFQNYDTSDAITLNPLSLEDLKSLLEKFTEGREKYTAAIAAGDSTLQKQSLLFLLALSSYQVLQEDRLKLHLSEVGQMMEVLEPTLERVLHGELKYYLSGNYRLLQFKKNLDSLRTTGRLPNQHLQTKGIPLRYLLSTVVGEQSTSKPEQHVISMTESNPDANILLLKLGLAEHYKRKLGLQDALCIRSESLDMSLKMSNPTEPKQVPFLALHKLMSFDSQCRSDLMKDGRPEGKSGKSTKIHPVDVLLALIICSDHFLRQDLFARLAKCQYAVPFILPDPFTKELLLPLWAMRSITKEWRSVQTVQGEEKVVEHTSSIVKYPMPIVSFLRLGKRQRNSKSKSKILNSVISESEHFFHRDLPGGKFKQVLGDGLVDMSWYLPAGERNDVFPDAVTFLNLHGDVSSHPLQSRFLSQISSMCFVLLTEEDLELDEHTLKTLEYFSSSAGGVAILEDVDEAPETLTNKPLLATPINLEELNAADITDVIQKHIRAKLFGEQRFTTATIEECCMTQGKDICVDESAEFFIKGQEQANEVTFLIEDGLSVKLTAKEEMLPLQGDDLWRTWGSLNKELHRLEYLGKKTAYEYAPLIKENKTSIRSQQLKFVNTLTPVMEKFVRLLLSLEEKTTRNFFLQHLTHNLNSLSGERISGLLAQYQSTQDKISELQQPTTGDIESKAKAKKENAGQLVECRGRLRVIQSDIVRSSFGLHHLLRELGQVYEAACEEFSKGEESSKYEDQLSKLPKVAAELLLDGYPLELMDGDAGHVPVKWVQAVISELNKKLNDPRMFVLSVLGLQSTGKSTMLNTVFGLSFNTSAGRCTRGAFMQLLPVDETIEAATGYSYVLVIDTEGLRTPELDSSQTRKHDNELATFIIGLANLTLINISGEVTGDLNDILQTTVHAFLRMNEVKHNASCQFIHQNSGASAKGQYGRDHFAKQLDSWTLDAAREESRVGQYEKFSDVIQFDDQNDVHHFPGLWKGDPPMAPINQGYSLAAQKMKKKLLQKLHREAKGTNVSSFKSKIKNLWEALLMENFVFGFKNTEEIVAYNLLGAKFNKWEREIQAGVLNWEKMATNEINSEKDTRKILDVVKEKQREIPDLVKQVYELQSEEMQKFFVENKLKGTVVQWKAKFEIKLEGVKREWEAHADNHCVQLGKGRLAISTFEQDRIKYITEVNHKAQKIITDMKAEQDELDESLENKNLDKAQLEKIMKHKHTLFTPEKMSKFGITFTQEQCCDLTEEGVRDLLVGEKLTPKQAKTVLKQGRLNEMELKAEFEKIWTELVESLPPVYNEPTDVEARVEVRLIGFAEKLKDAVKTALTHKKLRDWGEGFDQVFTVSKKKHYNSGWRDKFSRVKSFFQQTVTADPQIAAQKITNEVFEEAREYLESTKDLKTYFNDAYPLELLQRVDKAIEVKLSQHVGHFTFTPDYRIEVYLSVCGYAVVQFEEMAIAFRNQNDPREYLEKYQKEPLFTKFRNQYYQTAYEEAFADNLCVAFSAHIVAQIEGSLGVKVYGLMKHEAYLSDKMALKAKILIDLGTKGDFKKFMTYLNHPKQSLRDWIQHYTIEFCNKEESSNGTQLQVLAKQEVSQIISFLECKVEEAEEKVASKWLSTFCEDLKVRRKLGRLLDTNDLLPEMKLTLDLNNFKKQMKRELRKLEKKLHSSFGKVMCNKKEMAKWEEKPYNLLKSISGCTEQCPFCSEQCDLGEHGGTDVKHTVAQHRPQCCTGCFISGETETKILVMDICPTKVAGKRRFKCTDTNREFYPYEKYRDIYPDWHIPPDPAAQDSLYWMWFVGKYIDSLASHYKAVAPEVPSTWFEIEWEDVKTKLKDLYNL